MGLILLSDVEPATKLQWLSGELRNFREPNIGNKYIHRALLEARCPSAYFEFKSFGSENYTHWLEPREISSFQRFLLWIYCDEMAPLGDSREKEYLSAFIFAQQHQLHQFEEFLSTQFASFAPSYYGGDGINEPHDPSWTTLVNACDLLQIDSDIRDFFLEQFVRSWIYRQAYGSHTMGNIVDKYPEVAKTLLNLTQGAVRRSHQKSIAMFGLCGAKSPVFEEGDEDTYAVAVPEDEKVPEDVPKDDSNPPDEPIEEIVVDASEWATTPQIKSEDATPPPSTELEESPPAGYEFRWVKASKRKSVKRKKRILVKIEEVAPDPSSIEGASAEAAVKDEDQPQEASDSVPEETATRTELQQAIDALEPSDVELEHYQDHYCLDPEPAEESWGQSQATGTGWRHSHATVPVGY